MKLQNVMLASVLLFSVNSLADDVDDAYMEAKQRISGVITDLQIEPSYPLICGFKAGETYTVTAKIKGYHGWGAEYLETKMNMHDCMTEDPTKFECGSFPSDPTVSINTPWKGTEAPVASKWEYDATNGETINTLYTDFNITFRVPDNGYDGEEWPSAGANAKDEGRLVVFRWYQWESSAPTGAGGTTLMIGTRSERHYGGDMRRLFNTVTSDLNTTDLTNCAAEN